MQKPIVENRLTLTTREFLKDSYDYLTQYREAIRSQGGEPFISGNTNLLLKRILKIRISLEQLAQNEVLLNIKIPSDEFDGLEPWGKIQVLIIHYLFDIVGQHPYNQGISIFFNL